MNELNELKAERFYFLSNDSIENILKAYKKLKKARNINAVKLFTQSSQKSHNS
jgi:hypothetical protein